MEKYSFYKRNTTTECRYCDGFSGGCRKGHRCNWYKRNNKIDESE